MSSLYLPDAVCVGNMGCKMEACNGQSDVLRSRNDRESPEPAQPVGMARSHNDYTYMIGMNVFVAEPKATHALHL